MIFINELDAYLLKISPQTKNELPASRLSKVIVLHTYVETYIHTYIRAGVTENYQLPRSTQPGHPFVGRHNEYQPKGGDALQLGSKAGMVRMWVAGKTV